MTVTIESSTNTCA